MPRDIGASSTLLNRAMYKHTATLGVRYDPTHSGTISRPTRRGRSESSVTARSTRRSTSRKVVWEPKRRSTGEGKGFWWHLAAGLRFHRMADDQWCLSIRPERHLTSDGVTPLPPEQIGRRVTRLKARMFNDKYLSEVNFWRDFLASGSPRFVLDFGSQSAVVSSEFISFDVTGRAYRAMTNRSGTNRTKKTSSPSPSSEESSKVRNSIGKTRDEDEDA